MLYIIKDIVHELFGYTKTTVVKVLQSEEEVLKYFADPKNLKHFKGEIKVEKVIL